MVKSSTTLAKRLILGRAACALSQEQVAQAVGMTQPSYSALERGVSKSTSKIGSLSRLFEVEAYWLETGEGPMRRGNVAEARAIYRLPPTQRRLLQVLEKLGDRKRRALLELLID